KASLNQNLLNGAGVAAGDFDGDGWCDLYFCGLGGRNALYRNLGNWRFQDVTDATVSLAPTNSPQGRCLRTSTGTDGSTCWSRRAAAQTLASGTTATVSSAT